MNKTQAKSPRAGTRNQLLDACRRRFLTTDNRQLTTDDWQFQVSIFQFLPLPHLAPGFRAMLGGRIITRLCGQGSNSTVRFWKSRRQASRLEPLLTPALLWNEP